MLGPPLTPRSPIVEAAVPAEAPVPGPTHGVGQTAVDPFPAMSKPVAGIVNIPTRLVSSRTATVADAGPEVASLTVATKYARAR